MYKVILIAFVFLVLGCNNPQTPSELIQGKALNAQESTKSKKVPLVVTSVLKEKLQILLPENFKLMKLEAIKLKYPVEGRRPTEVYTNEKGTINIAFNHTNSSTSIAELPKIKQALEVQFNQPSIKFVNSKVEKINEQDMVLLEFLSPAADMRIYNLMFVTALEGRLFIGTFNCPEKERLNWEAVGKEIIQSIKI